MKKSQILAALALAFALGVVAPVMGASAKVVGDDNTTSSVTPAQMNTLNTEMLKTDKAFNELDNAQAYITLYNDLNGQDGVAKDILKKVNDHFKTVVEDYNKKTGSLNFDTINSAIDAINNNLNNGDNLYQRNNKGEYVNLNGAPTELGDAALRNLTKLGRANTIKEAYDAIKALYDGAKENQVILWANYKDPSTATSATYKMIQRFYGIEVACNAWLSSVVGYFDTNAGLITDIDNDIKAISQDALDNQLSSEAWVDAANKKIGNTISLTQATRFNIALNTARSLSKYGVSGQLAAAKANYDKINGSTAVDYDVALNYVKAMNTAIANFKSGKAPVTDTDTDTTLKPGNTGLVGSAEGTATTVSIVAGLATALTALGAGVVVYRNARREK